MDRWRHPLGSIIDIHPLVFVCLCRDLSNNQLTALGKRTLRGLTTLRNLWVNFFISACFFFRPCVCVCACVCAYVFLWVLPVWLVFLSLDSPLALRFRRCGPPALGVDFEVNEWAGDASPDTDCRGKNSATGTFPSRICDFTSTFYRVLLGFPLFFFWLLLGLLGS